MTNNEVGLCWSVWRNTLVTPECCVVNPFMFGSSHEGGLTLKEGRKKGEIEGKVRESEGRAVERKRRQCL